MLNLLKRFILIAFLTLMLTGCQAAAKPDAQDRSNKGQVPALIFADQYAQYICHYKYDQALTVSSVQNRQLINSEIKPFLQKLAVSNDKNRILFKEVQFLSAYLINGDDKHLLVLQALVPFTSLVKGERVMLHYEVRARNKGFEVVSSHIRLDSDPAPKQ